MRLDRIWRAGPFRGTLQADLSALLKPRKAEIDKVEKQLTEMANPKWQSVNEGRSMASSGLTQECRVLFAMLVGKGARSDVASNFVKSISQTYGSITFSAIKMDQLLEAEPCITAEIDGEPIPKILVSDSSSIEESPLAGQIYIELACRSMIASNAKIMGKYYDEVEVVGINSKPKFFLPVDRPYISTSRFLLITEEPSTNDVYALRVRHFPSAKLLSERISENPTSVAGIIQTVNEFQVFRSEIARRRWIYKHILKALLGASRALWVRRGSHLENILNIGLVDETTFIKRADFTGVFPLLASPIRSEISESEWGRIGSDSRIEHIGASVVDGKWEFEIIAPNEVARLPVISRDQIWILEQSSIHGPVKETFARFLTLPFDSESIRRIQLQEDTQITELVKDRQAVESSAVTRSGIAASEDDPATKSVAAPTTIVNLPKGDAIPITDSLDYDDLNVAEKLLFTSVERLYAENEEELRETMNSYFNEVGAMKEGETLGQYLAKMYSDMHFDELLVSMIPEWNVMLTEAQRNVFKKKMLAAGAQQYLRLFAAKKEDDK
jgi:hypothetical protein